MLPHERKVLVPVNLTDPFAFLPGVAELTWDNTKTFSLWTCRGIIVKV